MPAGALPVSDLSVEADVEQDRRANRGNSWGIDVLVNAAGHIFTGTSKTQTSEPGMQCSTSTCAQRFLMQKAAPELLKEAET